MVAPSPVTIALRRSSMLVYEYPVFFLPPHFLPKPSSRADFRQTTDDLSYKSRDIVRKLRELVGAGLNRLAEQSSRASALPSLSPNCAFKHAAELLSVVPRRGL
jgi:hypothetical protein